MSQLPSHPILCVQVVRTNVPFVPGAMVLSGLLSPSECNQLVAASEACG